MTPSDLTPEQRARVAEAVAIAALSALFVESIRWAIEEAKKRLAPKGEAP